MVHDKASMRALVDRVKTIRVGAALFRDIDPDLEAFISVDMPDKYAESLRQLKRR